MLQLIKKIFWIHHSPCLPVSGGQSLWRRHTGSHWLL